MHRNPLPPTLGPAFSTKTALAAGVTASRLRARDLGRPFHGVRTRPLEVDADLEREQEIRDLACAYAQRMTPHEFFSHTTAAVLWGVPLPYSLLAEPALHVSVLSPRRKPAGKGVRGHGVDPRLAGVRAHPSTGLRVTSPATTWSMLAAAITDLGDLIAAGDAFVREPMHPDDAPALARTEELSAAVEAGRRRGVGRLREALPLVRTRSASRPETHTRLLLTGAGLPEPCLNWEAFDARGRFLGRVDLAYPERKVAIEYEGEHHLHDVEQWTSDIGRYERLAADGWITVRVTRADLYGDPAGVVARVRAALARAAR